MVNVDKIEFFNLLHTDGSMYALREALNTIDVDIAHTVKSTLIALIVSDTLRQIISALDNTASTCLRINAASSNNCTCGWSIDNNIVIDVTRRVFRRMIMRYFLDVDCAHRHGYTKSHYIPYRSHKLSLTCYKPDERFQCLVEISNRW